MEDAYTMPSGLSRPRTAQSIPLDHLTKIADLLESAIMTGDGEKAKQFAERLAAEKLRVKITINEDEKERRINEESISVKVHVEDRDSSGCPVNLRVKPSDTIGNLKKRMLLEYDFPVAVQKWIVGQRIPGDDETLRQCRIKTSGHTLYVYLLTAKSAGLNDNQVEAMNTSGGRMSFPPEMSGDYTTMNNPIQRQSLRGSVPHTNQTTNRQVSSVSNSSSASGGLSPLVELNSPIAQINPNTPNNPSDLRNSSADSVLRQVQSRAQGQGAGRMLNSSDSGFAEASTVYASGAAVASSGNLQSSNPLAMPPPMVSELPADKRPGWECTACTFINLPTRPGCEVCSKARPADYMPPIGYVMSKEELCWLADQEEQERMVTQAEEQERQRQQTERAKNFQELMTLDNRDLIPNTEPFECPICFDTVEPGDGVVLRECLHTFCGECLVNAVRTNEEASLKCPFQDDDYSCSAMLQDREVRAIVSEAVYAKYLQRSLDTAESQAANSYHCKTPDCHGWCIYEDLLNFFVCPVCRKENCLTCKAIHENMNCQQYQDDLKVRAANDKAAQQTTKMLERLVSEGEAMPCPQCKVIVQKKDGCDWIKCSICKTEICWVTKGRRWGPKGEGDISGGCGCRVNGVKCDPKCNNCH